MDILKFCVLYKQKHHLWQNAGLVEFVILDAFPALSKRYSKRENQQQVGHSPSTSCTVFIFPFWIFLFSESADNASSIAKHYACDLKKTAVRQFTYKTMSHTVRRLHTTIDFSAVNIDQSSRLKPMNCKLHSFASEEWRLQLSNVKYENAFKQADTDCDELQ